jgi:rod shape-determining protein MreC
VSPALKRSLDIAVVVGLLAFPFFVLKANMKSPESQNVLDHAVLRVSTPIEVAASTLARGVSNVLGDYVYLVDVKQ